MKQAQDFAAFDKVAAYIVLNDKCEVVAKVHAHYGETVTVTVYDYSGETQTNKAGGGGYDRFTAALSGMTIDGHHLSNHCGERLTPADLGYDGDVFPRDAECPKGYSFANFRSFEYDSDMNRVDLPADKCGYSDCYRQPGLDYLRDIGYTVIQAV